MVTVTAKACNRCGRNKALDQFVRRSGTPSGYTGRCKDCNNELSRTKYRTAHKAWRRRNPDKTKAVKLKYRFGLSLEEYRRMLAAQKGLCKICGGHCRLGRSLAVDHCHTTGKIRGLLCTDCNIGISRLQDRPDLLRAAAAYLEGV